MTDETKFAMVIDELSASSRRRFMVMIILSILITFIMVVISMQMYNSSGAAQLDLSRPGYVDVRSQAVSNNGDFKNYSSVGAINSDTISEFKVLYGQQAIKANTIDAFGGDPLLPDSLGIGAVSE